MRRLLVRLVLVSLLAALSGVPAARADLQGSPDVAIDAAGTLGADEVSADLTAAPVPIDLGPLPDGVDVKSYSTFGGTQLFSVEHTVALSGGITARPRDLVGWDGLSYSIVIDGGAFGFPDGAAIDAFWADPGTGAVLISFDTTVDLSGTVVRDADVIDSAFAVVFDSAAAGLPAGIDVDGVSGVPGSDLLLLSFDVGGEVGGVPFADEDVLVYDPSGGTWGMQLDGSGVDVAWDRADLDAVQEVPEPGALLGLAAGVLLLAGLGRCRSRSPAILVVLLSLTGLPAPALAGDLEIDAGCATLTGCFGGDAVGYPVTIASPGRYRVTGNLTVANPALHAIEITADDVALDLGGFEIAGPVTCSGSGAGLSCDFAGNTGRGVEAAGQLRVSVRDGVVRGFPGGGVVVGDDGTVAGIVVEGNGSDGITAGERAHVEETIAFANGGTGIAAGAHSVVRRSIARENLLDGVSASIASIVVRSTAAGNGGDGFTTGGGSVVRLCASYDNGSDGISVGSGSRVSDCAVSLNDRVGIRAVLVAAIQGCAVYQNGGAQPDDYGLHLTLGASSYREVVVDQNGVGAGTVFGGVDMGANVCDGAGSCP